MTPMLFTPQVPSPLTRVGVPVGAAAAVDVPVGASMQYNVPAMSCEQLFTDGFACKNCDTVMPPAIANDAHVSPLFAVIVRPHALGAIGTSRPTTFEAQRPRTRPRTDRDRASDIIMALKSHLVQG